MMLRNGAGFMAGITLGSNISSLRAQLGLNRASSALSRTFERLASGQRINHASDDAAGLSIVAQLNTKGRVFTQAIRNINDGVSAASIAEGALTSLRDISERQLELAEQAANGVYSILQRRAMNNEANKLVEEFNRIVDSTTFNGVKVLDPATAAIVIQAGYGSTDTISLGMTEQMRRAIGDGTFSTGQATGIDGYAMINGDINGDGRLDIITASPYDGTIEVSIGNGDGTFRAVATLSGPQRLVQNMGSIVSGDFNNDGKLDFLASAFGNSQAIEFLGNGDGTFQAGKTIATASATQSLAVGDVNDDGKLDFLAVSNGDVSILLGNGNGTFKTFTTVSFPSAYGYAAADYAITLGDFNSDGRLDFLAANSGGQVFLSIGKGDGRFGVAQGIDHSSQIEWSHFLASTDFNGDGWLDVVIATSGSSITGVMLGNGNGTFQAAKLISGASETVRIADINGDGKQDLVDLTSIFLGNGDGTFKAAISTGAVLGSGMGSNLTLGDFNGDGRLDMANNSGGVFLGQGSYTSTAVYLNISTQQGARDALATITGNLNRIEAQLGMIGATTSRFQADLANLGSQRDNFFAAAGRIQDADIASSAADLVRQQIAQQAAAAVMAQANLEPQLALKLLAG